MRNNDNEKVHCATLQPSVVFPRRMTYKCLNSETGQWNKLSRSFSLEKKRPRSTENNDSKILLNLKVTWPTHRYWSVSDTQHILVITPEFRRSPTLSQESRGGPGGPSPQLIF